LEDLKVACAELSPRPNQQFEVGVFCGTYITPISESYLTHLDKLRGNRQMEESTEQARHAVATGVHDGNDLKTVIELAASNLDPARRQEVTQFAKDMTENGIGIDAKVITNGTREMVDDPSPIRAQDISLHNFNDHHR
jgi:amidophosphoribosyltransferase